MSPPSNGPPEASSSSQKAPLVAQMVNDYDTLSPPGKTKSRDSGSHGNSMLITAGILVGDTMGAGVLSMSSAIANFGWLLGSLVVCGVLALHLHMCMLLWRMHMHFPEAHTLGDLAGCTFKKAPEWQYRLCKKGTNAVQYLFIFLTCAADSTSWAKGLGMLFYDVHVCMPIWALIGCALVFPLNAKIRKLAGVKYIVAINMFAIAATLIIPFRHFARVGVANTRLEGSLVPPFEALTVFGVLSGLNIMTWNFTVQFMVVEVVAEMRDREQFPKALWFFTFPTLAAIFLGAGVCGIYYLGDGVRGLILNHLPFGMSLRLSSLFLVIFVGITFLLKSIVLCRAVHKCLDEKSVDESSRRSWTTWTLIVTCAIGCMWLISQLVPFFTPFVDLMGATLAPLCCMTIPGLMYIRWHFDHGKRGVNSLMQQAEWALIAFELVLSFVIMTVGMYEAFAVIVNNWRSFGAPFQCHCEHLWNTCACSANKMPMGQCPAKGWPPLGMVDEKDRSAWHSHYEETWWWW